MATTATTLPPRARGMTVGLYWRVAGIAFATLSGIGFLLVAVGRQALLSDVIMTFDTAHNVLHAALAAGSITLGFGDARPRVLVGAAKGVGVGYLALGVAGLVDGALFGLGPLVGFHLEAGDNVLHVLLGAWGLYAGVRG